MCKFCSYLEALKHLNFIVCHSYIKQVWLPQLYIMTYLGIDMQLEVREIQFQLHKIEAFFFLFCNIRDLKDFINTINIL